MSKSITARNKSYQKLEAAVGRDRIIQVWRKPFDPHCILGYPVGLSESLLLLHVVDQNSLALSGYSVVRLRDMSGWRIDQSFITRALQMLECQPVACNGIPLDGWPCLIAWVRANYSIFGIQSEKIDPGALYIGQVIAQKKQGVILRELDIKARWKDNPGRHAYNQITHVEFDSGYVRALAALAQYEGLLDA